MTAARARLPVPGAGAAVTMLQTVSVTTAGVLPAFLLGALAVQIRADLHLGTADIGLAAAAATFRIGRRMIRASRGLPVRGMLLRGIRHRPEYQSNTKERQ